jgi:ABC-type multidrug transport system permease subunit
MLRTLLAKDLARTRRNPAPWVISLFVPFLITALIGSIFGPKPEGGALGTIHVALVDEDDSGLGSFLKRMLEGMRTSESEQDVPFELDLQIVDRAEAVRRTTWGEFAGVIVLPAGFTDSFFDGDQQVSIELIKNPAQGIQPRVIEETLGLLVTALQAIKDLGGEELGAIRDLIRSDDDFLTSLARAGMIAVRARDRLEPVKAYLAPPLIITDTETRADTSVGTKSPAWSVFAFLLCGMVAMFTLYLIDHGMRDIYREMRMHTLERFKTIHEGLAVFLAGKVAFATVLGSLGALILLGGGALIFQFTWREPLRLAALVVAYSFCGAGLLGVLAALAGAERRADALANIVITTMAIVGGCMFPIHMFPVWLREGITPLMPTAWFAGAARAMQDAGDTGPWLLSMAKCLAFGVIAVLAASALFRRRIEKGLRA